MVYGLCVIERDFKTGAIVEPVLFYMGHDGPEMFKEHLIEMVLKGRDEACQSVGKVAFLNRISLQVAFLDE